MRYELIRLAVDRVDKDVLTRECVSRAGNGLPRWTYHIEVWEDLVPHLLVPIWSFSVVSGRFMGSYVAVSRATLEGQNKRMNRLTLGIGESGKGESANNERKHVGRQRAL